MNNDHSMTNENGKYQASVWSQWLSKVETETIRYLTRIEKKSKDSFVLAFLGIVVVELIFETND